MGEFLLSVATPEFWSEWGFRVLLIGLAGDLLVLVIPSRHHRTEKILSVLFTLLVFAGVYLERVGSDAIEAKLLERATRAEGELRKHAARDLSADQQERVASSAKSFAGQRYETAISQGIDDGFSFWKTLHLALNNAGWEYVPPAPNSLWVGDPPASIPLTAIPGVTIFVDPAKMKELEPAVMALGNALLKEGIKTTANVTSYPSTDETKQKTLQIVIGVRAQP